MKKSKPWYFGIFRFIADDGKHTVSVGAETLEDGIALITDIYGNVSDLRIIPKEK